MRNISKLILILMLLFNFTTTYAGGYGNLATPTRIDVERGNCFAVYGAFGNPNNCTNETRFYVPISHPQYDQIYSLVLSALASSQQILPYFHKCDPITWYSSPTVTYNHVAGGSVGIRNGT